MSGFYLGDCYFSEADLQEFEAFAKSSNDQSGYIKYSVFPKPKLLRKPYRPIYKPTPIQSAYTSEWQGPSEDEKFIKEVYGIIINVREKLFYILTCYGVKTFQAEYLKDSHNVIGSWLLLGLRKTESGLDIFSKPEVLNHPYPLQTRIVTVKDKPTLLVYDYVRRDGEQIAYSKFVGKIESRVPLSNKGKIWNECNVEYIIRSKFYKDEFRYKVEIVKFHGALSCYADLPLILSFKSDEKGGLMMLGVDRDCLEAIYSEQERLEIETAKELRRQLMRIESDQEEELPKNVPCEEVATGLFIRI